jgi:choline dehydrogenase-like flavoprotein
MNTRMGNRLNTGMTYLDAATRARPNLTIRGRSQVDSVILDCNRATGVRLIGGRKSSPPKKSGALSIRLRVAL